MTRDTAEEAQAVAIDLQSVGFIPSAQLQALLDGLSAQQAQAVIRIAQEELRGRSLTSLLTAADRVCSYSTFWHKKRGGWIHQDKFRGALELARHEVRMHRLTSVIDEAVEHLKISTLDAARDLHRQVTGDLGAIEALSEIGNDAKRTALERRLAVQSLGMIGSQAAVDRLLLMLETAETRLRKAIVEALGIAGVGADSQRRLAARAILDRADKTTASKSSDRTMEDLSDDELESIARQARGSGSRAAETPASTTEPD